ncbi:MAG: hypothetical protein GSR80_000065 [Desulfurococcales archaeon]|nr:hypothetical protein [Desulfurococcales archaeon]
MQSSRARDLVEKALEAAARLEAPRLEGASEVVIASCPGSEAYGGEYYLALRHSGVRALHVPCIEAAVHVLPYSSGGEVVVAFSAGGRDSYLMHLANAAAALGLSVSAYGPPLHPAYSDSLAELGVEYHSVEDRSGLALLIAPLMWSPKPWEARRVRLEEELRGLPDAIYWVRENYSSTIEILESGEAEYAAYTPTTEPGVRLVTRYHNARLVPLSSLERLRGSRIVAFYASVEEHAYKQALLSAKLRGVKIAEARLNTDPLTAPLYIALMGVLALPDSTRQKPLGTR